KNIGIDLGIKEFATMSDCIKVENLKLTKEYEKKLKREPKAHTSQEAPTSISGSSSLNKKVVKRESLLLFTTHHSLV
ncbi:MAG: hypothetical protein ACTTJX_10230, partial [Fusobacterium sp.]